MNTDLNFATNHGTTDCAADAANEENTQKPSDLHCASQKRQECSKSNDESTVSNGIDKDPGVKVVRVLFSEPGPLYMDLYSRYDGTGAYVKSFRKLPDGSLSKAQACGEISINDALYALNDCVLNAMPFTEIIELIRAATFPLVVTFHRETTRNISEESEASHCTKEEDYHRSWGLNFGQMIDWSAKSDRVMDGLRGASRTASLPLTKNRRKCVKKKFQTNDVKTFLKRMGRSNPSSEKDLDSTRVVMEHTEMHQQVSSDPSDKLTDASQKSKAYHTTPIFVAVAWERVKDQHDSIKSWDKDDLTDTFHFKWYRKTESKELSVIKGVHSATYNSTLDDVGCLVACRLTSRKYPELVKILEASFRFEMSPSIENTVQHLFDANCGSFSATLASCDSDHFQIRIDKEQGVQLSKISDQSNDAGLVASCSYHRDLQVLLDPLDSVRFILKVKEFGTFLGNKIGDVCDMSQTNLKYLESVSCFFLVAPNPEHRDIIAALVRRIRQSKLNPEEEEKARHDEWSLYMDPAYSAQSAEDCVSSDGEDSSTRQIGRLQERIDELNSSDEEGLNLVKLFGITHDHLDNSKLGLSKPDITQALSCSNESILTSYDSKTSYDRDHTYSLKRENEILQDKLMSLSITLKTTEDESETCKALLDVKDQRIEGQQLRINQLETKLDHMKYQNKVLCATASELKIKSSNLEEDVRRLQSEVQKLQTSNDSNSLYTFASEEKWKNELYESQRMIQAKDDRIRALELSMMELQTVENGLVAKCKSQSKEITRLRRLQERTQKTLEEKRFKDESRASKSKGKSSELELFDDTAMRNGQRVHPQSSSRSSLPNVQAADSCNHDKSGGVFGLESLFLGAKGSSTVHSKKKRKNSLLEQNQSLQRVVNELTDALHMQREQMEVLKEINSALAAKLAPYTNCTPSSEDTSNN